MSPLLAKVFLNRYTAIAFIGIIICLLFFFAKAGTEFTNWIQDVQRDEMIETKLPSDYDYYSRKLPE